MYIYIYMFVHAFSATACEGWVLVNTEKQIKAQKAARQKPNRKQWEKGRNTQNLEWMKHQQKEIRPVQRIETYKNRSETTEQRAEWVEVFKHKARKVETVETSPQVAERLEVFSKPNQQRLRQRQVYNEQNDSRCCATQGMKVEMETSLQRAERVLVLSKPKQQEWDGDKSTSRATESVKKNKARFKTEIKRLSSLR